MVRVISPQCGSRSGSDHWTPGLRCISYAQRRINELRSKPSRKKKKGGRMEDQAGRKNPWSTWDRSLSLAKARAILLRGHLPATGQTGRYRDRRGQSETQPDFILIDGVFRENLSPGTKRSSMRRPVPWSFARRSAARSSMGALRAAAELDFLGMIGTRQDLSRLVSGCRHRGRQRSGVILRHPGSASGRACYYYPFHDPPGRYPGRSRALRT